MLKITAEDRHTYCDGIDRRSFLQVGALSAAGLTLPDYLRAQARSATKKDTACILIWLDGGPTHVDTYDLKPDAPKEYRGPMKATKTNVSGIDVCELMPEQAKVMDKLAIVRSIHHTTGDHFAGAHWMLTGYHGSTAANRDPMYPGIGAVTAKLRGASASGLPAYVSVPYASSVGIRPGYFSGAYLGTAHNPFETGGNPNSDRFSVQNLRLPNGMTLAQVADRRRLLGTFDNFRRDLDGTGTADTMDQFQREAFEMITGPRARRAFNIAGEDPRTRDRYGRHAWGQSVLLARRLVEAGVTFVSVHAGGWDHHSQIEKAMQRSLPPLDRAIGALVSDLSERGLYDKVCFFVCGEFGRTPKVNGGAGRDHWGQSGFALMGGGGLKTGRVIGSTTAKGERPKDQPATPGDMLATVYHALGIDTSLTFTDNSGRPHPILNQGKPIAGLV